MNCNTPQTITEKILCAKVCYNKITYPVAKLLFKDWVLFDDSTYYDGDITNRQIGWLVYVNDVLYKEIGYGLSNEIIPFFGNGSTYGNIFLGVNNQDFYNYIESFPNTQIPIGTKFTIFIQVIDSNGYSNQNISNKYTFTR